MWWAELRVNINALYHVSRLAYLSLYMYMVYLHSFTLSAIITRNHGHLSKFGRDVAYAKLDIPEVQDNIPDDLRRSVCSKSEPKASPSIR